MNKSWQTRFRREFGVHFSKSELDFAVVFIEDVLDKEVENKVQKSLITEGRRWRENMAMAIPDDLKLPLECQRKVCESCAEMRGYNRALQTLRKFLVPLS